MQMPPSGGLEPSVRYYFGRARIPSFLLHMTHQKGDKHTLGFHLRITSPVLSLPIANDLAKNWTLLGTYYSKSYEQDESSRELDHQSTDWKRICKEKILEGLGSQILLSSSRALIETFSNKAKRAETSWISLLFKFLKKLKFQFQSKEELMHHSSDKFMQ